MLRAILLCWPACKSARVSQSSFSGWPEWPFTHVHVISFFGVTLSKSSHKSRFFLFLQPFVIVFTTQAESVNSSTVEFSGTSLIASITARSSILLLVVWYSPPSILLSRPLVRIMAAQPPGPGFPMQEPSVNICTCIGAV